jgi:D-lactate dehydrogenase (cytochrome)
LLYNDKEHDIAEELVHRMVKRAIEMEGTATGEHGVGLVKRDYLEHELGQTTVDLMRKVRLILPACNPSHASLEPCTDVSKTSR